MTRVIRVCRKCGAKIFSDAPKGLCTACALETALGIPESVAGVEDPVGADTFPRDETATARIAKVLGELGEYELVEEIGRGGQGVVFRARQKSLNRTVALKIIGLGQWASKAHIRRFRLEAEAAARLDHPCIVPIYEVGEQEGCCYFSMKFVEGGQLDEVVVRTPMPIRQAAELMAKVARTVHYAHEHGILHRDIKPGNILLDAKGEPHLTDFGLARLLESESTVTRTLDVLGTPSYMAPEQAAGNNTKLTSATDVYGVGAVLYQLLTGHSPFAGGTTYQTIKLLLETEPRPPRLLNRKIDRDLSTICLKCLEKDPQRRYSSALALAEDLERWLKHEPIRARHTGVFTRGKKWLRRNPTTAALITVVTVALAGLLWELPRVKEQRVLVRRAKLSEQEKARLEAEQTNNPAAYEAYLRGRAFPGWWHQEGAIRLFQEAVKLDPSFGEAWAYLSIGQSGSYWLGTDPSPARLAAAKDALDRALALDPDLPETHLALGYYRYYGPRDYAGALAEFQQAEKGLPNSADVIEAMASLQRRLGHWDEAVAEQRRAVEIDPRNIHASFSLATTYRCLRRFPEALATVDRALAWTPANRDLGLVSMKADLFLATGDLQAIEPLLANPRLDPTRRAIYSLFQRRYAEAIGTLSQALTTETDRDTRNVEKFSLGLSQQRAGDVAAARATYRDAVQDLRGQLEKEAPDSFAAGRTRAFLGQAYAGFGEAASAIAEGQKAMAIDPSSKDPVGGPDLEEKMAQIYALLGDADHAIPILKRLLQIPYGGAITPALLRLDPIWDQIRNDPAFQKTLPGKTEITLPRIARITRMGGRELSLSWAKVHRGTPKGISFFS
jgi:tetratricopeptide (TPR) repeat protein/predicted Ser/Thr protein kinase